MFIVLEIDSHSRIVKKEYNLNSEDSIERFTAQTNIQLSKKLFNKPQFRENLFNQLDDFADENNVYMLIPVTIH